MRVNSFFGFLMVLLIIGYVPAAYAQQLEFLQIGETWLNAEAKEKLQFSKKNALKRTLEDSKKQNTKYTNHQDVNHGDKEEKIDIGKQDVRRIMGDPELMKMGENGSEIWFYDHRNVRIVFKGGLVSKWFFRFMDGKRKFKGSKFF